MAVDLEALDEALNSNTLALLGDTITYTPAGGSPQTIRAIADYSDGDRLLGSSKVLASEAAVEVPVAIIAQPAAGDVITLPRTGLDYQPKQFLLDESGMNWLIL